MFDQLKGNTSKGDGLFSRLKGESRDQKKAKAQSVVDEAIERTRKTINEETSWIGEDLTQLRSENRNLTRQMDATRENYAHQQKQVENAHKQIGVLREDNAALREALKTQMKGLEDMKVMLLERIDSLSTDIEQVHRKVVSAADSDMSLVKQMASNHKERLDKLTMMALHGKHG